MRRDCCRAGLDAFAHSVRDRDIDDEFMGLAKQRPALVVVPNLPDRGVAVDLSWLAESVPAGELSKLQAAATNRPDVQQAHGIQARNLAKLSKAGVKIALGTDGNVSWAHHLEMEDMVVAGMTPAQVLVASTGAAAEFLRMPDVGTVAAGKSADFVVLDANPLENITNTRRISSVYLRGTAVDRAGDSGEGHGRRFAIVRKNVIGACYKNDASPAGSSVFRRPVGAKLANISQFPQVPSSALWQWNCSEPGACRTVTAR